MLLYIESVIILFAYEELTRYGVFCFVFDRLALFAVIFLRECFLIDTTDMEPLSLAVGIVTTHHLAVGTSTTDTILRLFY